MPLLSPSNLLGLLLAAVSLVIVKVSLRAFGKPSSKLPGPWYAKWTQVILDYHFMRGTRCRYVHELHLRYGPVVLIAPGHVNVMDVEAMRTIYGARETFRKSQFYRRLAVPGHQGLFNTVDIQFHRRHRKLLAGPLAESSLWSMLPRIEARVALTLSRITEEMEQRGATDVFKWWLFMATDLVGELCFGGSFEMLEQGHKNQYSDDLEHDNQATAIRCAFPTLVGFCSIVPLPFFNRSRKAGEKLSQYAIESLERHQHLSSQSSEKLPATLFAPLFKANEDGILPFNEIVDEAQNFIAAGSDTVSIVMTYLTWSVCRDSTVRSTLVHELTELSADFGEADLRTLPYLNYTINEALRLYSTAPGLLPRLVPAGGIKLAGHCLEEGVEVSAQSFSMHRDPAVFPAPEEFQPMRWSTESQAMKAAFIPFGRGARGCIGQHLARIELRLATARFFRSFPEACVSSLEGMTDKDMEPMVYLTLTPAGKRCLINAR